MHTVWDPGTDPLDLLAHLGEEEHSKGAVIPPIYQNSLFVFETTEGLLGALEGSPLAKPDHYSRLTNPTMDVVEKKIAALEGAEACKVVGSGMAAMSNAVMSTVREGSHVVLPDTTYGPVRKLVDQYLPKFGVTHTYVHGGDIDEIVNATRPETSLIYLESPTSALFRLQDVPAVAEFARSKGISTVIDNTYATPLFMRPIDMGIDIVCHSATKYMGGHSDITAGTISTTHERMEQMMRFEVGLFGNALHPMSAWLLNRGLRTMPLRLTRHEQTANEIAAWVETRPEVDVVHHVSLPSFRQRDLFLKTMKGSTGLFSFELKSADRATICRFCDALQVFQRGISWGGHESLVVPIHVKPADYDQPKWAIRLYCGLESVDMLKADLERGFAAL
jgi:cystathionine beta-lyase